MSEAIENLAHQYGLFHCVECGLCVAICPMEEIFADFSYEVSPRGVIERTILDFEVEKRAGVWFCLTCDLCTELCPAGVRFRDFVEEARVLMIEAGITEHGSFCRECGVYLYPLHTVEYLKQTLGESAEEMLKLCHKCRKYDFANRLRVFSPGRPLGDIQLSIVRDDQ
jgi:heterodisulfide reductase subunit C